MKRFFCGKKNSVCLAAALVLSVCPASADISAGIYSYYVWWRPSFANVYDEMKTTQGFMTGPMVSWSFSENWSLSLLAIITVKEFHQAYTADSGTDSFSNDWMVKFESDFGKLDIDASVSYSLNSYFKLFSGVKYFFLDFSGGTYKNEITYMGETRTEENATGAIKPEPAFGLGAGLGISYPLIERLSLGGSASILYYPSYAVLNQIVTGPSNPGDIESFFGSEESKSSYVGYGFNTTFSISYYIPAIDLSIAPGGRFQFIRFKQTGGDELKLQDDYYYGITLSILYYF